MKGAAMMTDMIDTANIPAEKAPDLKPKESYTAAESIFALIFSFSGYFFIKTFFSGGLGLGSALFMLGFGAAAMAMFKICGAVQSRKGIAFFIAALVFSANLAITSNGLIMFLDFVYAVVMYGLWAFSVNDTDFDGADDYLIYTISNAVFGQSFGNMGKCPSAVFSLTKKSKCGKNIRNILIGLIIALPVTLIVTTLLSSADNTFKMYINGFFNGITENCVSGVLKYIFGLPLSFLMFGVVIGAVRNKKQGRLDREHCGRVTNSFKIAPQAVVCSSVVPLCIVYLIFFFTQLRYFLSAFGNILPEEYSAAEYARKGFFELCTVAVINLSVIAAINLFCRYNDDENNGKKRPVILKVLTIVLSVFTLILIATAMSKMFMYISRFGLTAKRVYTTWFMLVLTVLFLLIIIRQFRCFNMARLGGIIFTVILAALSFCQMDSLIVSYNVNAYEKGRLEEFDNTAFYDLSADAVYAIKPLLESDDGSLKSAAELFIGTKQYDHNEPLEYTLSSYICRNAEISE